MNQAHTSQRTRIEQALSYAHQGIRVIPLRPNSKEPILNDWPNQASADGNQVHQWFETYPDCNYGLLMGEGIVVIDVDNKKGKDGNQSLEELRSSGEIPQTLCVATPNNGRHYYLKSDQELQTRHPWFEGIDFQASRSYVVGPGSAIDEREYLIVSETRDIAPVPDWLIEELQAPKGKNAKVLSTHEPRPAPSAKGHDHRIDQLLSGIDPDLPHDQWIEVLFAILNVFGAGEKCVEDLRNWSKNGTSYTDADFDKAIKSHDPTREQQVGIPRLRELARRYPRPDRWLPFHPDAEDLERRVLNSAIEMMKHFGNNPTEEHLKGIRAIVRMLTHGIYEQESKFRNAFPLETGMGKTTCVVALAKELQHTDKSLLIAAERIEQLDELQEQMLEEGVDPAKIGIFHRSEGKYPYCPSIKVDAIPDVQFLLLAHNRIKSASMRATSDTLLRFKTSKRDLVIWDESLIPTSARYAERRSLRKAISNWSIDYEEKQLKGRHSPNKGHLYEEFSRFLATAADAIAKEQDDASVLSLPVLAGAARDYDPVINTWGNARDKDRELLRNLVSFSNHGDIRIVCIADGSVVVQFVQTVDEAFDKIVVLDASAQIRDLVAFDPTVTVFPLRVTKDYGNVSIRWADAFSSKDSFERYPEQLDLYLVELDAILAEIPKSEPLLVFCLKDLKEKLVEWKQARHPLREIEILHWGLHRASNRYSHIKYMATVGVQYRDTSEIAASIIGQTRTLNYPLVDADVRQTKNSEQAELLYQGISRGNSRRTSNGKAGEQTIYLFHPKKDMDQLRPLLDQVMPNAQWTTYETKALKKPARADAEDYIGIGDAIAIQLASTPPAKTYVSVKELKRTVAPSINSNTSTWRNAKRRAESKIIGWEVKRQGYQRRMD